MRVALCLLLLSLVVPALALPAAPALGAAAALGAADQPAAAAVVAYGAANLDAASGLVKDPTGVPNLAESSIGYVAACFALGQELPQAQAVLGKLLERQQKSGTQAGLFPWYAVPGCDPSEEAMLYLTPLLAQVYRVGGAALGAELQPRLQASLELVDAALARLRVAPQADTRYLLRAAARATVGAALGGDGATVATAEVAQWLRLVSLEGLPEGHSPTFDAARLIALKWVREVAPEAQREPVDQALRLVAADLALRVDTTAAYPAGAIAQAFPVDYASATGFIQYVLYTDFGLPLPEKTEPYLMAALLPAWRTPQSLRALAEPGASGLLRTRGKGGAVSATDTYLGTGFSLGTMSAQISGSALPIFLTFARTARPDAYFYCSPTPCAVQSVQADGLAVSSFNFDGLATPQRKQAYVRGVLGLAEDIDEVNCYGVKWNDLPTSLGEQEKVAFTTRGCYVGITIMRVGPASNQTGIEAKPVTLKWSGEGRQGDLLLTIYARQADYVLPRPENNVRAGVVVEVAPQTAYLTLEEFVKHLGEGKLKQTIRTLRQRVPAKEKPRDPNVLIPEPQSRADLVYRDTVEQTTEYSLGEHSLTLVEDLIGNLTLSRSANGTVLDEKFLWESEKLKYEPALKLGDVLAPFAQ